MARSKKEFARVYGSRERVAWVASLSCVGCGVTARVENAHVVSGGTGRKADYRFIVPLCNFCHHELHQHGHDTFEAKRRLNLTSLARLVQEAWEWRQANNLLPEAG